MKDKFQLSSNVPTIVDENNKWSMAVVFLVKNINGDVLGIATNEENAEKILYKKYPDKEGDEHFYHSMVEPFQLNHFYYD